MEGAAPESLQASRKFVELVRALHELGYEGLRPHSGLAPPGCHRRRSIRAPRSRAVGTQTHSSGAGFALLFG